MSKITLRTLKSFITKNRDKLHIQVKSRFDGMVDCVTHNEAPQFAPVRDAHNPHKNNFGMAGVWFVFDSRDSYDAYDDGRYEGYSVYNCCGSFVLAIEKQNMKEAA